MKGFIEITVLETQRKLLVNVAEIKCVEELEGGNAEITIVLEVFKKAWGDVTVFTQESYAEVVEKIKQANKAG